MRILEQNRPPPKDEDFIRGQDIEQINSEITELLKTERVIPVTDIEARCDVKMELIKKYIRAIFSTANKQKRDVEKDPIISAARKLEQEFHQCALENVNTTTEIIDDRYVNYITIDFDERTMKIVPDAQLESTLAAFDRTVRLRLLIKLSKIASELANLLAPEIDLHKDLTRNITSQEAFEGRYFK